MAYCQDVRLVNCAACGRELRGDTQPTRHIAKLSQRYKPIAGRIDGRPLCASCFESQIVELVEHTVGTNH